MKNLIFFFLLTTIIGCSQCATSGTRVPSAPKQVSKDVFFDSARIMIESMRMDSTYDMNTEFTSIDIRETYQVSRDYGGMICLDVITPKGELTSLYTTIVVCYYHENMKKYIQYCKDQGFASRLFKRPSDENMEEWVLEIYEPAPYILKL